MSRLTLSFRLVALFSVAVGIFLLLGSAGHLGATMDLARGLSLPTILLLLPGALLLAAGLFNLLASLGLWKGKRAVCALAVGLNGALLAYLVVLLVRGVPGHPLWFFTLLVSVYLFVLMVVQRLSGKPVESVGS